MGTTHIIYDSNDIYDDALRDETRAMIAEANNMDEDEVTDCMVDEAIMQGIEDERMNLDKEVNGVIVAFADLGLWDGHHNGIKIVGTNVSDILTDFGGDMNTWFADRYNVRCVSRHHDGTNQILFRYVDDMDKARRLERRFMTEDMTEDKFVRATKTLVHHVNAVYGW